MFRTKAGGGINQSPNDRQVIELEDDLPESVLDAVAELTPPSLKFEAKKLPASTPSRSSR